MKTHNTPRTIAESTARYKKRMRELRRFEALGVLQTEKPEKGPWSRPLDPTRHGVSIGADNQTGDV